MDAQANQLVSREDLEKSQSRNNHYQASLKIARLGSWEWDIIQNTSFWSDECHRIFELNRGEVNPSYDAFLYQVHPDDLAKVQEAIGGTYSGQGPYEIVHRVLTKDKKIKYTRSQGQLERDSEGNPVKMIGTLQDVTDLVLAEQKLRKSLREKEILLQEVHHRVKNNIQQISSLLRLQRRGTNNQEVKDAFNNIELRVQAISLIHEILSGSNDISRVNLKAYLQKLAINHSQAFHEKIPGLRLNVEAEELELDLDTALQIGLIINELITNSLQHAFQPKPQKAPAIDIDVHSLAVGKIMIDYKDNGVGLDQKSEEKQQGMGLKLLEIMVQQLNGTLELKETSHFHISLQPNI